MAAQHKEYNFKGKVAYITGASSGIGLETALQFGANGAKVVLVDVDAEAGQRAAQRVIEKDGEAIFIRCDVSRENEVKASVDQTIKHFGRLDFAFNNAGIEGAQGATQNCDESNWDKVIGINLKGVWLCMKYQVPQMLKQGSGSIVNCSSIAGLVGFGGIPAYVASKHGVIGLTRTAALECAKSNIRVNAVCPGVIRTPMIERFSHGEAQIERQLVEGEPIGRIGQPPEVASAVLWLCSDSASFVTGHPLAVDGGWTAQ